MAPIFVLGGAANQLIRLISTSVLVEWEDRSFVELAVKEISGVYKMLTTKAWFASPNIYQEGTPISAGNRVKPVYWGMATGCPKPGVFGRGEMVNMVLFYILDGRKGQLLPRGKLTGVP